MFATAPTQNLSVFIASQIKKKIKNMEWFSPLHGEKNPIFLSIYAL